MRRPVRIIRKINGYFSSDEMEDLHRQLNLKPLAERRKLFMLKLVYKLSREEENINNYRPQILSRTGPKVQMKIAFTDKERVLRSPYYLCNRLWDKLNREIQLSKSIWEFKSNSKRIDLSSL